MYALWRMENVPEYTTCLNIQCDPVCRRDRIKPPRAYCSPPARDSGGLPSDGCVPFPPQLVLDGSTTSRARCVQFGITRSSHESCPPHLRRHVRQVGAGEHKMGTAFVAGRFSQEDRGCSNHVRIGAIRRRDVPLASAQRAREVVLCPQYYGGALILSRRA